MANHPEKGRNNPQGHTESDLFSRLSDRTSVGALRLVELSIGIEDLSCRAEILEISQTILEGAEALGIASVLLKNRTDLTRGRLVSETNQKIDLPGRADSVGNIASQLGALSLAESIKAGNKIEIPSLGITLTKEDLIENPDSRI